jgi:hypothetical protein
MFSASLKKLTTPTYMHIYIYISLFLFFFRSTVYADRKHINCRPPNDVSNDYYYNYYDIEVLFFELNQKDVHM